MLEEGLRGARRLDVLGVREERFQVRILLDQRHRRLRPDPPCARDVVRGIPDERQIVDHAGGRHAELLARVLLRDPLRGHARRPAAPRVHEAYPRLHELVEVLVARNDDRLQTRGLRLHRQGADHVVGFVPLEFDHRVVEGLDDGAHPAQARPQVVGHLLTRGLVLRILDIAERHAGVEDHRQVIGLELLADVEQKAREAERCGRIFTGGVRERAVDEREIRPVDERVGVDQEDAWRGLGRDVQGRSGSGEGNQARYRMGRAPRSTPSGTGGGVDRATGGSSHDRAAAGTSSTTAGKNRTGRPG